METKRIFVLGNGFDLAHYLPTSYGHFMSAMKAIEEYKKEIPMKFDDLFIKYLTEDNWKDKDKPFLKTIDLYKTDELKLSVYEIKKLREKLKTNGWYQHFSHHLSSVETWIDFENEIQNLLVLICDLFELEFDEGTVDYWNLNESKFSNSIDNNHSLKMTSQKVLFKYERQINEKFFKNLKSKERYFTNTLKYFGILEDLCVTAVQEHDDLNRIKDVQYERISKESYDTLKESISSFPKRIVKDRYERVVDTNFLRKYSGQYLGFDGPKILKVLLDHLNEFNDIFKMYIEKVINLLEPKRNFKMFGNLNERVEAVFTFNYSNSFERLYPHINLSNIKNVQYVHGSTRSKKIVLGISDLEDERLKKYKVYGFVKTHQKIINDTDYLFLDEPSIRDIQSKKFESRSLDLKYTIIVWGHSLDISDEEYIREIFDLNSDLSVYSVSLEIWYHKTPHESLANLMNIMGKDVIQKWMKEGWLTFKIAPNIYEENS